MSSKQIVKAFYDSDIANDPNIVSKFFHVDSEMHWTSSHGFMLLKYNDIVEFFEGTRKSYTNLRFEFSHFLESNEYVTTRHTLFGNTIENPDNEQVIAHFSAIWEVRDGKLYRGFEISHQVDENNSKAMESYTERKI